MIQKFRNPMKCLLILFLFVFSATAQIASRNDEVEVSVIRSFGMERYKCYAGNKIINEEDLKQLSSNKDCSAVNSHLKVDFARQTLIAYHAGGDCFLRVSAKVFRNDRAKKYIVRITNKWGGCRAGGSFQGWLTIEKIPADYAVDFVETKVTRDYEKDSETVTSLKPQTPQNTNSLPANEVIETRPIDLKGCIQTHFQKVYVIKDEETYLKAIRNDASRDFCLSNLEKIDFDKHSLLGIEINSGYCRIPLGLEYKTIKDATRKQYVLDISYDDPGYETCRALSQYDLWVLVRKIPEDYEAVFNVKAKDRNR